MRIYLDNCSLNRPFDDQSHFRVRLETEAKLYIQQKIREGEIELAWSYILDFENQTNPFLERREAVDRWRHYTAIDTDETTDIIAKAKAMSNTGIKSKDALHLACAIAMRCEYFVTTDDRILNRMKASTEIRVIDPVTFVREVNL